MHLKKSKPTAAELARQELEQKVDAMMSVEQPAAGPAKKTKPAKTAPPSVQAVSLPVAESVTAPELPSQLLKTIGKKPAKSSIKIIKEAPADQSPDSAEPEPADPPDEPVADSQPLATDDPLDDAATDQAVDSIVSEEADMQLAVADAVDRQRNASNQPKRPGLLRRFFTSFWTWLFIIGIAGVVYAWYH